MEDASRRYINGIGNRRVLGKGTYTANFEVRRLVELKGAFEGGLDLGTDFILRLPDLLLLLLAAIKTWGAPVLDHPPLGSRGGPLSSIEATLEKSGNTGSAGGDVWGDSLRVLRLPQHPHLQLVFRRHLHYRHSLWSRPQHRLHHRLHHGGSLVPGLRGLRDGACSLHLTNGLLWRSPVGPFLSTSARPGGILLAASAGLSLGTSAGFPLGAWPDGVLCAMPTGVTHAQLRAGRRSPPGYRRPELLGDLLRRRGPPLGGCGVVPGVADLPILRALVGASEGTQAVGTFMLSRASEKSSQ